jgi:hypothetical protein
MGNRACSPEHAVTSQEMPQNPGGLVMAVLVSTPIDMSRLEHVVNELTRDSMPG